MICQISYHQILNYFLIHLFRVVSDIKASDIELNSDLKKLKMISNPDSSKQAQENILGLS